MAGCLAFLFLAFLAFSANADVSFDCGASGFYTDENSIVWMGDEDLFKESQAEVVQSSNTISHVMSTLRVFTTRKKNCYSISEGSGSLLLVRASFFYGNYDKRSSPPSFDMHIDGNDWATVKTSLDQLVYYELVYVSKGDTTSICLAQTQPKQFPFISALEVRNLDSKMYSYLDPKYALFLRTRVAYGAKETVRFPDDAYDRIWVPAVVGSGITSVASDAIIIDVNNAPDYPPQEVLQNAITISSTSDSISLKPGFPDQEVSVYMNFSSIPSGRRKKSSKLPVILGTTIPISVIFWAIMGFVLHHKRKTAAIVAITTGQTGGAHRPSGAPNMMSEAVINEIKSYTDENSITWRGDDDSFSEVLQSSNTVSHVMSTLRVFTSRKKNFYFIIVDKGPLLVRASFYYGNYDRKLSPPSFDLLIDGNHWTKVITSLDQLVYYEVVYVVESDATSICLAQTQPDQFPFISALEVRSLDPKIYVDPKYALFVRSRFAYGASATVRCPDDVYDRIWVPYPMKLMYQKILRKPSCRMPLQPQACLKV
ncbi:LOW QUALITY PROTEIN: hypothetical protein NC652_030769 [Populus alba x Populus x berolinensis]|nr:LOW QUALITY PROTEIN: hypothetical protein NC652_030769 [Populus alba x Populus x berolinensis]